MGPCFGLAGAPRCPVTTALAVAQAALLSGNAWGPRVLLGAASRAWQRVCRIHDWGDLDGLFVGRSDIGRALADEAGPRRRKVLYAAFWLSRHARDCGKWLRRKSGARRWWPTDG
eukprot:10480924-Alexandrium_andersonii.AAC.1